MADLKTTAEERARMQRYADWITAHAGHSATELRAVARAVPLILSDLNTLLAENARLRAVAEAARDACNIALNDAGPEAFATIADLRKALAALEAP